MKRDKKALWTQFLWRVFSCHIVTYFIAGILALSFLKYEDFFTEAMLSAFMRPIDSPWVAAGPLLQVFRGILFAFVLWPIRETILETKRGWLKLWLLFLGLAILGTVGPSPGSLEGIIYTKLPLRYHLWGLPEVLFQTLFFSYALYSWYQRPTKVWNIIMSIGVILIILMSGAGLFLAG